MRNIVIIVMEPNSNFVEFFLHAGSFTKVLLCFSFSCGRENNFCDMVMVMVLNMRVVMSIRGQM